MPSEESAATNPVEPSSGPPPLPPPPLGGPPPLPPERLDLSVSLAGRLHPWTILVSLWQSIGGLLLPALAILLFSNQKRLAYMFFGFMALNFIQTLIRYFTFEYRIEHGELITKTGLLERQERHIPLDRIQDIRLEQGVLHRLLNVVDAKVETAGGGGAEASLSVLSRADAERLQQEVGSQARRVAQSDGTVTLPPPPTAIRRLSVKELIYGGLTSNRAGSALVVFFALFGMFDDVLPKEMADRFARQMGGWLETRFFQGMEMNWLLVLFSAVGLILLSFLVSAAGSVVLFYNFTLSIAGDQLRRSYGLFTRRASALSRKRIQIVQLDEGFLRRFFGLVAVRADSAGSPAGQNQEGAQGRDVLLPVVPKAELPELLPFFLPEFTSERFEWKQVSRCAIRRGLKKAVWLLLLAAAFFFIFHWPLLALLPILFIPFAYLMIRAQYQHLGFAFGDYYFQSRHGWLNRSTHITPVRNIQSIELRQTPFDRKYRVLTLLIDTAGQAYTGGGPQLPNLDEREALRLARSLAAQAATTKYRW